MLPQRPVHATECDPRPSGESAKHACPTSRRRPTAAPLRPWQPLRMEMGHFLQHRPLLYHYTSHHGVERLRDTGLWCAEDLLLRYGLDSERIHQLTRFPRHEPEVLNHEIYGPARLSHQRPMLTARTRRPLAKLVASLALTNTSLADFCQMLAHRVFLFPTPYHPDRTSRPAYGFVRRVLHDGPLSEVAIRTADLLTLCDQHGRRLELSAHNSGSAPQGAVLPKGRGMWKSIEDFTLGVDGIREVAIDGSLPPLGHAIEAVTLIEG